MFYTHHVLKSINVNSFYTNHVLKSINVNMFSTNYVIKSRNVNMFYSNHVLKSRNVNMFYTNHVLKFWKAIRHVLYILYCPKKTRICSWFLYWKINIFTIIFVNYLTINHIYIYIYRNVCKYVVYISRIRVEHYRYKCMYFINLYISVYVQGDTRKGHIHFKDLFCL